MKNYFVLLSLLLSSLSLNAQIVNIPDTNFKNALLNTICADLNDDGYLDSDVDTNNDGEIQNSEAQTTFKLVVNDKQISTLSGIEAFTNLKELHCKQNLLTDIDLTGLDMLETLDCKSNQLSNLDLMTLLNLEKFFCSYNQLTSLNIQGLSNLIYFHCDHNQLTDIDLTGLTNLEGFKCDYNQLTQLDLTGFNNFRWISCQSNQLTALNLAGLATLERVYCNSNQISSLYIPPMATGLEEFHCRNNNLAGLAVPSLPNLESLTCDNNPLTYLSLGYELPSLETLSCDNCQLTELFLYPYPNLEFLNCRDNSLGSLDLSNQVGLKTIWCENNQLTTLSVQDCGNLESLNCSYNHLTSLFLKNGSNETVDFSNNWDLVDYNASPSYICCDEFQVNDIEGQLPSYYNTSVNSFCTFVPGGVYFPVQGENQIDIDGNGCDNSDPFYPNLKYVINSVTEISQYSANSSGYYSIPLLEGMYTISPLPENPDYFSVNVNTLQVDFPGDPVPLIHDFCFTPNGIYHDVSISIIPVTVARPGFNASYKIIYKNKGTQIESGSLSFSYDDDRTTLSNISQAPDSQSPGQLDWNYSDLLPLESRVIHLTLKLNTPSDTPPVNIGNTLGFGLTISTGQPDETPGDNIASLFQSVVGAYDPNDKTCLQGNSLTPDLAGGFVDYLIRFENTGNYPAENIVIKDIIDTTKFDITTLQITDASHDVYYRLMPPNRVEFIFENIHLPFDNANNDGYVAFKIKTIESLELGDSLTNEANIYFDFNLPITTNETQTIVEYADHDQDGYTLEEDCNDNNENINPGLTEITYNGIDDDCNPATLDDDLDQDGFPLDQDCNDNNENINPGLTEITYNGIDDDCNPATLDDDLDQDGFPLDQDCDDNNENINPGLTEITYNGIDDDCDPATLDDDLDQDGFPLDQDCDDNNENINPGLTEITYNGIDDDCDPATLDDDLDQDGFPLDQDCDDNNENINPGLTEITYNGIDDDCDPATLDDDLDQDGFPLDQDCDDNNENINPGLTEITYNGIDDDCDPATLDDDLDQDGFPLDQDCDDNNPDINPGQQEVPNNGLDDNCNGEIDEFVSASNEIVEPAIEVYPNPTRGILNINSQRKVIRIEIFDLSGRTLKSTTGVNNEVNILDLQNGTYLIKVSTTGKCYYSKVVKI